jgi:hypothetical protein
MVRWSRARRRRDRLVLPSEPWGSSGGDHAGVPEGDGAGGKVEVVAAGSGGFGAAHAGGGEHQPHRVEPLRSGLGEEAAQLLGVPHGVCLAGLPDPGGVGDRVVAEQPLGDRVAEGAAEHDVHAVHGARVEPGGIGGGDAAGAVALQGADGGGVADPTDRGEFARRRCLLPAGRAFSSVRA